MPRRVAAHGSALSPYPGVYLLLIAYSFSNELGVSKTADSHTVALSRANNHHDPSGSLYLSYLSAAPLELKAHECDGFRPLHKTPHRTASEIQPALPCSRTKVQRMFLCDHLLFISRAIARPSKSQRSMGLRNPEKTLPLRPFECLSNLGLLPLNVHFPITVSRHA